MILLVQRLGKKLFAVRSIVHKELLMLMRYQPRDAQSRVSVQQEKLLMGNIERDFNDDRYQIGQVKRFRQQ